jgi:hypothetical protein
LERCPVVADAGLAEGSNWRRGLPSSILKGKPSMSQPTPQHSLLPQRLMQAIAHTPEESFVHAHRNSRYLAVAIGADVPELIEGLELLWGETKPARPMSTMAFKTSAGGRSLSPGSLRPGNNVRPIDALTTGNYHVVEIGKRGDLDGAFPERISVGRAANKDIVLRHVSVSKFHGWFEIDDTMRLYVVDAGSTNHTVVRNKQLIPRARAPVPSGTSIRFGSIDTIVVDAACIWNAFHPRTA